MGAPDLKIDVAVAQAELAEKLSDPFWRIFSGELYKIIIKGDSPDDNLVMPFKPNRAQRRFIKRMWHRNIILKARQLGFTTLVSILWLDFALFNDNVRCGIVAQHRDVAAEILRDKVKFAYENLPDAIKAMMPLKGNSATEIHFKHNNSSIRVATSYRGGTPHRLHISEFGKICAKFPQKAKEVVTGSIPACPQSGILIVESTAEGAEGYFHDMTQVAIKRVDMNTPITKKDYRFHFYAWWEAPEYRISTDNVVITAKEHKYFDKIEATMRTSIDNEQRAWYVKTKQTDFAGDEVLMWQEYPSTPQEAFEQSSEGRYYSDQMTAARQQGRILNIPVIGVPVNTFWDIGNSDGTAIWWHQLVGMEDRFIGYYEEHGADLQHYYKQIADKPYIYNKHFFPHDGDHERLSSDQNKSIKEQMEDLGMKNIEIVPRIKDINAGIFITKKHFPSAFFHEKECAEGIKRLDNYKRKFNTKFGRYVNEPEKLDGNSEGADALRGWAQAKELGMLTMSGTTSTMGNRAPTDWRG
jgi:hypothetical protein